MTELVAVEKIWGNWDGGNFSDFFGRSYGEMSVSREKNLKPKIKNE